MIYAIRKCNLASFSWTLIPMWISFHLLSAIKGQISVFNSSIVAIRKMNYCTIVMVFEGECFVYHLRFKSWIRPLVSKFWVFIFTCHGILNPRQRPHTISSEQKQKYFQKVMREYFANWSPHWLFETVPEDEVCIASSFHMQLVSVHKLRPLVNFNSLKQFRLNRLHNRCFFSIWV